MESTMTATSVSAKMVEIYGSSEGPRYEPANSESHGKIIIHHPHMSPKQFVDQRHHLTCTEIYAQLELIGLCIQRFTKPIPKSSDPVQVVVCKDTTLQGVVQRFLDQKLLQPDAPSGGPILNPPAVPNGGPIPSSSALTGNPVGYDAF